MLAFPNINPIAFSIHVHWYSLAYLAGVLLGWVLIKALNARQAQPALSKQAMDDIMVYAILGIVLGGRLGYVLFYKPAFYLSHPQEILMVWQGGMSFHGGLIGMLASMLLFCRKYKLEFLRVMDLLAVAAPIGICLGRLANFINGELYGRVTDSQWGMIFPTDPEGLPRYPSQLIEAGLEGVVLFFILLVLAFFTRTLAKAGRMGGLFLIGYSFARSTSELFREPDNFIHFLPDWITMGQLLSLPMLLIGLYLVFRRDRHQTTA